MYYKYVNSRNFIKLGNVGRRYDDEKILILCDPEYDWTILFQRVLCLNCVPFYLSMSSIKFTFCHY